MDEARDIIITEDSSGGAFLFLLSGK